MQSCRQEYSIHGKVPHGNLFIDVLSPGRSEEEDCLFKLIRKHTNPQEEYLKHTGHCILHVIAMSGAYRLHLIRRNTHLLDTRFEGHNRCVLI